MGMPCEINSILKAKPSQGYPESLTLGKQFTVTKDGYRIIPIDVPITLVDERWEAHADIIINKMLWEGGKTRLSCVIHRIYDSPFLVKVQDEK